MRILVDTNILYSALMYPCSKPAAAFEDALHNHTLVLSGAIENEFLSLMYAKAPEHITEAVEFFESLPYEFVDGAGTIGVAIRDIKDLPILSATISADVDIMKTYDKDFLN